MNAVDPNSTATPALPAADAPAAAPEVKAAVETLVATSTDAVKAARYEAANAALEAAAAEAVATAAAEANAAKAAEAAKVADADTTGKLSKELAAAQAKADMLAAKAPKADKLEQAAALAKAGKHYDAIQLLSEEGISFDAAVQQLVNPSAAVIPADTKAKDEKPIDPEVAKLRAELDAVNKRLADSDAAVAAANKESGRKAVVEHVKASAKDYPFLASNEAWVTQALADAEPDYAKAVDGNGGNDIPEQAKNDLIIKALAAAEAKHKATASAYLAVASPGLVAKKPNDVVKVTQPTLTITSQRAGLTPAVKSGKTATLEELKRARREAN